MLLELEQVDKIFGGLHAVQGRERARRDGRRSSA